MSKLIEEHFDSNNNVRRKLEVYKEGDNLYYINVYYPDSSGHYRYATTIYDLTKIEVWNSYGIAITE